MAHPESAPSADGRVRVLHLVSTFARKTDTKWLRQLLAGLSPQRFTCSIGCMYGGGPMQSEFESIGVQTFNLQAGRALDLPGLLRLIKRIRQFHPHIVHTHLLRADLYGGLAARLAGVETRLTSQYAIYPYTRAKRRWCDGMLDRICRSLATNAMAVSEAVRHDLIQRVNWPAERTCTVHTGLDFEAWCPNPEARHSLREQWSVAQESPVAVTVARLSREKGLDVLIEAAGLVLKKHPAARFVIAGDGPLAEKLNRQIRECGLGDCVRLIGFCEDVPSLLSAADLFVLPSYMEGMPNALLEAYAARLPVIASAVGGLNEAVESERTGLLVPAGDPDILASAILRVICDPQLAGRLAETGARVARCRFDVNKVARDYETLYERIIQPGSANRAHTSAYRPQDRIDEWDAGRRATML